MLTAPENDPVLGQFARFHTSHLPAGTHFIMGRAISVNTAAKTVTVEQDVEGTLDSETTDVPYDLLVLATGSRYLPPIKVSSTVTAARSHPFLSHVCSH